MVEKKKRAGCIKHKKTFSFVKLLHWLNIFETFCKKKTLVWNSTFCVPKLFHNTTVLFWKCSSKHTSRYTLLSTIEVSPEKKNDVFFSIQNFSVRSQKKKKKNYQILFVCARYDELQNTLKQKKKRLSIEHSNRRKQVHEPQ